MVLVDYVQAMLEQSATKTRALLIREDTEPGQIPMLEGRMGSIHLLQHREHVPMLLRIDGICEHGGDRHHIDTTSGRQPQRNRAKVTQRPDRRLIKRIASKRRDELAENHLIFRQIGNNQRSTGSLANADTTVEIASAGPALAQ
jgi:hypothetical protein